jgi:small subunit ribosomal protein S20
MPNIKSAIKRVKVTEKKNLRNRMVKSAMKTQLKKFETALVKEPAAASALLAQSAGAVDRAASKGVIHKNAANRRKSRMALRLNKVAAVKV